MTIPGGAPTSPGIFFEGIEETRLSFAELALRAQGRSGSAPFAVSRSRGVLKE